MHVARFLARFKPRAIARIGSMEYNPGSHDDIDYVAVNGSIIESWDYPYWLKLEKGNYDFTVFDLRGFECAVLGAHPLADAAYLYGKFERGKDWFRERYARAGLHENDVHRRWARGRIYSVLAGIVPMPCAAKAMMETAHVLGAGEIKCAVAADNMDAVEAAELLRGCLDG